MRNRGRLTKLKNKLGNDKGFPYCWVSLHKTVLWQSRMFMGIDKLMLFTVQPNLLLQGFQPLNLMHDASE